MTLNCDWGEPWNSTNPDDSIGVEHKIQFQLGWYANPIVNGDYPQVMKDLVGTRLPTFTPEQSALVKNSFDFFGMNHYTTSYTRLNNRPGHDWASDQMIDTSFTNATGHQIGPMAQSPWLAVYGPGIRGLLNWINKTYADDAFYNKGIYIFENGVSVPGETSMSIVNAVQDTFRVQFYQSYIDNVRLAITEDGINVKSYFAWSFMDNFEWDDGYNVRFGITYVDYSDQQRYLKNSAFWFSQYIKTQNLNGEFSNPYIELARQKEMKKQTFL